MLPHAEILTLGDCPTVRPQFFVEPVPVSREKEGTGEVPDGIKCL